MNARYTLSSSFGDYDGDGDLARFVSSIWTDPRDDGSQGFEHGNRLYRNDGGMWSDATEEAGARITLTANGEDQLREIIIGSNFTSQRAPGPIRGAQSNCGRTSPRNISYGSADPRLSKRCANSP